MIDFYEWISHNLFVFVLVIASFIALFSLFRVLFRKEQQRD